MKTIYFDENLSHFWAQAFDLLSKVHFPAISVKHTTERFGRGADDEDIIPVIGEEGGILLTKDMNIQRTRLQNQLCEAHKLGAFFLKMHRGQDTSWEIIKVLATNWEYIVDKIQKEKYPFAFRLKPVGKPERM
ncbi:MAG: hypothetical protein SH848_05430 [Saprospiraceae bacterium]|nr:hypothetical protein [Saprospiraceae bacterium]